MTDLVKVRATTAAELLEHIELSDEAAPHLVLDTAPEISITRLMDAGLFPDAIKLLARGLPKREAVWWSCLCARDIQSPETDDNNVNALIAAENWVKSPTEERRQACKQLGEMTQFKTPASWAATAAAWCHGSLAGPDEPAIEPPEHLYAHAVAGSVTLAAVLSDPVTPDEPFTRYLQQGLSLARGGNGKQR
ncbi:hypothetical protein M0G74_16540 [Microbulbifer sp. CAU 1566]|uniref:DUF6931 family protein n=1 Tax=unclassified Microbulbifer TaxID=2619833 RepID=UPI0013594072|nr:MULTISPECIES: hypothetical protein [unclassified Microbulbifer]MCK7598885.1 hypothetical protein [Microbulbifer sp. CAU 1566]